MYITYGDVFAKRCSVISLLTGKEVDKRIIWADSDLNTYEIYCTPEEIDNFIKIMTIQRHEGKNKKYVIKVIQNAQDNLWQHRNSVVLQEPIEILTKRAFKTSCNSYAGQIKRLSCDEVFVFGSNSNGFHGAGSAGYASFGESGNVWRQYEYDKKPYGWKGLWNQKGFARGFQIGKIGRSYAINTIKRAGCKKSISENDIIKQIAKLYRHAEKMPFETFYIAYTYSNRLNLNGYTDDEMVNMFFQAALETKVNGVPVNIRFEKEFSKKLDEKLEKHAKKNTVNTAEIRRLIEPTLWNYYYQD